MRQEITEKIFESFQDVIRTLPIMVALRDRRSDKYLYSSHKTTWTGQTVDEWNALTTTEKRGYLFLDEYASNRKQYNEWLKDNGSNALRLMYRIKSTSEQIRWIQCQFEKYKKEPDDLIIEISWDLSGIVDKIVYDDETVARLIYNALKERDMMVAQMGVMRNAIESLYNRETMWAFVQEVRDLPKEDILKAYDKHFPKIMAVLDSNLGRRALERLHRCQSLAIAMDRIRKDLCPALLRETNGILNQLMELSAYNSVKHNN